MAKLDLNQMVPLSSGRVLCTRVTLDSVWIEMTLVCARLMRPGLDQHLNVSVRKKFFFITLCHIVIFLSLFPDFN